jgi:parvulin-like peptidyl-prolyl isomerase
MGETKVTRSEYVRLWQLLTLSVVALLVFALLCAGGFAGCKAFNRAQRRADANNNVKVTAINIRRAQQQARIVHAQNAAVQARAEQRLIEARGIRRAQDEISATLTDRYLQHEAIKAMQAMASSGRNNTALYIPSGPNAVPLVNDIGKRGGR